MSEDNPRMAMYEAQAIAIEKQQEIDRMKKEKKAMTRRLKILENILKKEEKPEQSTSNKNTLDDVWATINKLQQENNDLKQQLAQTRIDMNSLWSLGSTILITGVDVHLCGHSTVVLSSDRSKWIELQLDIPFLDCRYGVIYANGEIYVFGNQFGDGVLYKMGNNLEWKKMADMNIGRSCIINSCLEWNGYIWVFGGEDRYKKHLKSVERYDPKANKWTLMPDMIHPRREAAAILWNNRIIVSGGQTIGCEWIDSIDCFKPYDGSWTELPGLPAALYDHCLVPYNKKIIAIGGYDGLEVYDYVWEIDPLETKPKWKMSFMKYPRGYFPAAVIGKDIYAIDKSGKNFRIYDQVQIFDGKDWRDGPSLPCQWVGMSAVIIPQIFADHLCYYKTKPSPEDNTNSTGNSTNDNKCIVS